MNFSKSISTFKTLTDSSTVLKFTEGKLPLKVKSTVYPDKIATPNQISYNVFLGLRKGMKKVQKNNQFIQLV